MNNSENPGMNSWERIQGGVKETERLIGQKQYNISMVKARQTLEHMVRYLCEKSNIAESGLIDMIDALYENRIISDTSCEHYHKIRTIGNKAIHEEDNSAYNANQAHHLLSQEVYTFANDYSDKKRRPIQTVTTSRAPASRTSDSAHRTSSRSGSSSRRRGRSSRPSFDPGSLLKPLLLLAIIIVLIFIIKMINPSKKDPKETTAPVTTEIITTTAETTAPPETTTAPVVLKYKTTDTVNVRPSPSTDMTPIGLLVPGTEVEYVSDYDDKWCIIKYMDQDAYVAKEFLQPVS